MRCKINFQKKKEKEKRFKYIIKFGSPKKL